METSSTISNDNDESNTSTITSTNSTIIPVLKELQQLFTNDPNTERISLRSRHLSQSEAEEVLHFLKQFPRLRHLDLRDNNLHELPPNFGVFVPKLVALNLLNNNFRFRKGALGALGETLQHCPCLKSLSLSLSSPEEQMLLNMLPRLRILNGTPLPSTTFGTAINSTSPTLKELQKLCASPSPKVALKPHKTLKTSPDSGFNTRRSTKNSVRPTEMPVSISDERTDWCKLLKVKVSNGDLTPSAPSLHSNSIIVSTETFLHQLKAVVKAFHASESPNKTINSSKSKLFAQLDRHVELLAQQLKRQEPEEGKGEVSDAMLQTRWSLLEVCAMFGSQKVAQADAGLGSGFGMLQAMQKQLLAAMQTQKRPQSQQNHNTTVNGAESTQTQLQQLLDVAEGLENDLEAVQLRLQEETARREQVEQENLELKRDIDSGKSGLKSKNSTSLRSKITDSGEKLPQRIITSSHGKTGVLNRLSDDREAKTSAPSTQIVPPPTNCVKTLTLKQLVDLINCVYASKIKYDLRAGGPRETMEQHLYTYLNTRFGLPKLIVDYASAIWKAAEFFARSENDAAVFIALLNNRLDEGFLEIKRKLQSALVELLRAFFAAKFPKKQGKSITELVQSRLDGLLHEEEWRNLLTYLYEPQDSAILLRLVQQKAEKYQTVQNQGKKTTSTEKPSLALPFTVFEQVLYGYQLQGRLDLLDGFRRVFEDLDTERVGVINRARFVAVCRRLAPMKPEAAVATLIDTLDPFNHDVITFSDAANALLPDIRRNNMKTNSNAAKNK